MPYDETLAERIRKRLARQRGVVEKKMFGGIAFLRHGNILVGVWKDSLIVRVGPDAYDAMLDEPFTKPFDVTGRPMTGWVLVDPGGLEGDDDIDTWVGRASSFVKTLPKK